MDIMLKKDKSEILQKVTGVAPVSRRIVLDGRRGNAGHAGGVSQIGKFQFE